MYADVTQLNILFKCNNPLALLPKLNNCISDIRVWMIKNTLKINDSKTEFIVFRSPQATQDLSSLSVYVGDNITQQSSKLRDLGVIFDQFLSFDDYISSLCRSTHFHLRNIGRIRHFFYLIMQLLSSSMLSFRLVLITVTQCNLPKSNISRLQRIKNQAACILTVVVFLPRSMEGMGRLQFSDLLTELPVPPQAVGVGGIFYVLIYYI